MSRDYYKLAERMDEKLSEMSESIRQLTLEAMSSMEDCRYLYVDCKAPQAPQGPKRYSEIGKWLGQYVKKVLNIGFNKVLKKEFTHNQAKAFCS